METNNIKNFLNESGVSESDTGIIKKIDSNSIGTIEKKSVNDKELLLGNLLPDTAVEKQELLGNLSPNKAIDGNCEAKEVTSSTENSIFPDNISVNGQCDTNGEATVIDIGDMSTVANYESLNNAFLSNGSGVEDMPVVPNNPSLDKTSLNDANGAAKVFSAEVAFVEIKDLSPKQTSCSDGSGAVTLFSAGNFLPAATDLTPQRLRSRISTSKQTIRRLCKKENLEEREVRRLQNAFHFLEECKITYKPLAARTEAEPAQIQSDNKTTASNATRENLPELSDAASELKVEVTADSVLEGTSSSFIMAQSVDTCTKPKEADTAQMEEKVELVLEAQPSTPTATNADEEVIIVEDPTRKEVIVVKDSPPSVKDLSPKKLRSKINNSKQTIRRLKIKEILNESDLKRLQSASNFLEECKITYVPFAARTEVAPTKIRSGKKATASGVTPENLSELSNAASELKVEVKTDSVSEGTASLSILEYIEKPADTSTNADEAGAAQMEEKVGLVLEAQSSSPTAQCNKQYARISTTADEEKVIVLEDSSPVANDASTITNIKGSSPAANDLAQNKTEVPRRSIVDKNKRTIRSLQKRENLTVKQKKRLRSAIQSLKNSNISYEPYVNGSSVEAAPMDGKRDEDQIGAVKSQPSSELLAEINTKEQSTSSTPLKDEPVTPSIGKNVSQSKPVLSDSSATNFNPLANPEGPKKTHSPSASVVQDLGVGRTSGATKRPTQGDSFCSDSARPAKEPKIQNADKVQESVRVAVVDFGNPERRLTETQWKRLETRINQRVDEAIRNKEKFVPFFGQLAYVNGFRVMECENIETLEWLKKITKQVSQWFKTDLRLVSKCEILAFSKVIGRFFLEGPHQPKEMIELHLQNLNPEVKSERWKVLEIGGYRPTGMVVDVLLDPTSVPLLGVNNFRVRVGTNVATIKILMENNNKKLKSTGGVVDYPLSH